MFACYISALNELGSEGAKHLTKGQWKQLNEIELGNKIRIQITIK